MPLAPLRRFSGSLVPVLIWTFVLFAGVTLTLLYAAGAAVFAGQVSEDACYPLPELVEEEGVRPEYGKPSASFLPLGIRCTFSDQDGSVAATTLEPGGLAFGWILTVFSVLCVVALLLVALLVAGRARDRGLSSFVARLLGALVFLTPPLGILAAVASKGTIGAGSPRHSPGSWPTVAGKVSAWGIGLLATLILAGIFFVAFETERINSVCSVPPAAANEQWPEGSSPPTGVFGSLALKTEDSPLPFVKRCIFTDPDSGEVLGVSRAGLGLLAISVYFASIVVGSTILVASRAGRASLLYAIVTLFALPLGVLLAAGRRPD